MRYLSICSGIEAATVAWHPLDWSPAAFSEIDAFPRAVLAHHYPDTPLHGDFSTIGADEYGPIDLLVGGTPCQSFSIAGLRGGLDDDRGNLALEFCRLARRTRARWIVWENVPGVLSVDCGHAFASILGGLAECGYGLAYRVLDAQYVRVDGYGRAVPQRRRRVFVVGYLGDWRRAAAVLFERQGLRRDTPPRRKSGQDVAPTIAARTRGGGGLGTDFDCDGGLIPCNDLGGASHALTARHSSTGRYDPNGETFVAHSLRGGDFDTSEDGTGRGTPLVPVAYRITGNDGAYETGDHVGAIGTATDPTAQVVALQERMTSLNPDNGPNGKAWSDKWAVRRLTPTECERLQGFPEIAKSVTIFVWPCSDQAKNYAHVDAQNLKSLTNVFRAEGNASLPSAALAGNHSVTNPLGQGRRAVLNVLINSERGEVEIRRAGRLIWCASIAGKASASPLSMPLDGFVRLVVPMLQMLANGTHAGEAGSPANISVSTHRLNGNASVHLSGAEIAAHAADAETFTKAVDHCTRFITSGAGLSSQNSEPIWTTWSSCVAHAIASFIPAEMRAANSYAVNVELRHGYTAIPYRGKPAADGPRYKALGNSFAVNVVRWLGQRIQMVEDISDA